MSGVDGLEGLLASGQLELLAVDAVYGTGKGFSPESASADRPLRVRSDRHLRELVSLIGGATPHLQFERDASVGPTCARCGEWIGVYEPAVIVVDGPGRVTSRAAEPDAVAKALERYRRGCYADC